MESRIHTVNPLEQAAAVRAIALIVTLCIAFLVPSGAGAPPPSELKDLLHPAVDPVDLLNPAPPPTDVVFRQFLTILKAIVCGFTPGCGLSNYLDPDAVEGAMHMIIEVRKAQCIASGKCQPTDFEGKSIAEVLTILNEKDPIPPLDLQPKAETGKEHH